MKNKIEVIPTKKTYKVLKQEKVSEEAQGLLEFKELQKIKLYQELIFKNLEAGVDFGIIPSTDKPTLLLAGAEKIALMLGVIARYEIIEKTESETFLDYTMKCMLTDKQGNVLAEGIGNKNSVEKNIAKDLKDHRSLKNNIIKLANKRAFVDAVKRLGAGSSLFVQDFDEEDEQSMLIGSKVGKFVFLQLYNKVYKALGITKDTKNYQKIAKEKCFQPALDLYNKQYKTNHEKLTNDTFSIKEFKIFQGYVDMVLQGEKNGK